MKIALVLLALVAAASVLPSASAIWLRTYNYDSTCSADSEGDNMALLTSGKCARSPDGYYFYQVTCATNGSVIVAQSTSSDCSSATTVTSSASNANSGGVCIGSQSSSYFYKVYCNEAVDAQAEQATMVKSETFSAADCGAASLQVTSYHGGIGDCTGSGRDASQSWITGNSVRTWSFHGAGCAEGNATSVAKTPFDTCLGSGEQDCSYTNNVYACSYKATYNKYSAPSGGNGPAIPDWAAPFPPANSLSNSVCTREDCSSADGGSCYVQSATLLGRCDAAQGSSTTSYASYCASSGHVMEHSWYADRTCKSASDRVTLETTGRGSCSNGRFSSCPGVTSNAPTLPTIARQGYSGSGSTQCANLTSTNLYRSGACLSGTKYTATGTNQVKREYFSDNQCSGTPSSTSSFTDACSSNSKYFTDYQVPATGFVPAGSSSGEALPAGGDPDAAAFSAAHSTVAVSAGGAFVAMLLAFVAVQAA